MPSRGSSSSSAKEAMHCRGSDEQVAASTPSAQPLPLHPVPTLSAQPCLPHSSHHNRPIDVLAMVRNRGRGPAPRSALIVEGTDGELRPADVDEQQERQPLLGMGARYTLGARAGDSSSGSNSSRVHIPVAFDVMAMVRDRSSEPTPPPPPPLRSASTAVDRPHGEPLAREPANVIERQKVQSASRVDAGACNASGVACGWRPGRGSALIDNAVPAPTGAGGSGRDCARTPDRWAATTTDRGLQGGWGSVSDQSPSFDVMAVVRNHGSKPMPPAPSLPPLCGRRSL